MTSLKFETAEMAETGLRMLKRNLSPVSGELLNQLPLDGQPLDGQPLDRPIHVTTDRADQTLEALRALGFETQNVRADLNFIEGRLSAEAIASIHHQELEIPGLMGIASLLQPRTSRGRVTSQADSIHESRRVRQSRPKAFEGRGVRVGVLSDSYDVSGNGSAAEDTESGDLPEGIQILQEGPERGIDEGRAMLQLIHDLAPGADLAFSSVVFSEADFAQQIVDLANPQKGGVDIIVDDIVFLREPMFQDGVIAQAIDQVVDQGVAYFSAAGNQSNRAYESSHFAVSSDSEGVFSNRFHDFDPGEGVDTRQRITLLPGAEFIPSLQWDDPFYTLDGVDTDLDLFLLDAETNLVVARSIDNNLESQIPSEILSYVNPTDRPLELELVIVLAAGPEPGRIRYVDYGNNPIQPEFATGGSTIVPHAAAVGAQAVAAINYFDQDRPASFSSEGPSQILFDSQGNRLPLPQVRSTPDITAIQATDTTFFGRDIDQNGFPNFSGTSAAAPHAAAIAALVLEANPHFTPEQLYQRLQDTAIDIGPPGADNQTGAGLINAYDAVFGPATPVSAPFFADFDAGDLPRSFVTRTTGAGQIRLVSAHAPGVLHDSAGDDSAGDDSAGGGLVVLDSAVGIRGRSANELTLLVDLSALDPAASETARLSFEQREFNDEDDRLPASFTGSVEGDGVSLSLDGGNRWFRLFDLTGPNSGNAFEPFSVNLSHFAADRHLTLGSEIQIKFQQVDNAPVPQDGFAFDNIGVSFLGPLTDLTGGQNSDRLSGSDAAERLLGFAGQDQLQGFGEDDVLEAGDGDDWLEGGDGNDRLLGGQGQDRLWGDAGDDYLDGGSGDNILSGGAGRDLFVLSTQGKNRITDFAVGQDLLALPQGLSFGQLAIAERGDRLQISTRIATQSNRPLALLQGIRADQITASSFIRLH